MPVHPGSYLINYKEKKVFVGFRAAPNLRINALSISSS
jgi:hypothetical protein